MKKKYLVIEYDMDKQRIMTKDELLEFGKGFIDFMNEGADEHDDIEKIDANNVNEVSEQLNSLCFLDVTPVSISEDDLEKKLIQVAKKKKSLYAKWQNAVRRNDYLEDYASALMKLDGVGVSELVKLGYLQIEDDFNITYKIGNNRKKEFLHRFAFYHTTECGLVNSDYNDYYEVARLQGEITVKSQEDFYQEIVEEYLGECSDYMDFLLHCVENPTDNIEEGLAREEFVGNWHEQYKRDVKKMYGKLS